MPRMPKAPKVPNPSMSDATPAMMSAPKIGKQRAPKVKIGGNPIPRAPKMPAPGKKSRIGKVD